MAIDAYVLGSNEFVPVTVLNDGVAVTDGSIVHISVVPTTPGMPAPGPGSWSPAAVIGSSVGFYTGTLTAAGVYAIYVKVDAAPQEPILYAGRIHVY